MHARSTWYIRPQAQTECAGVFHLPPQLRLPESLHVSSMASGCGPVVTRPTHLGACGTIMILMGVRALFRNALEECRHVQMHARQEPEEVWPDASGGRSPWRVSSLCVCSVSCAMQSIASIEASFSSSYWKRCSSCLSGEGTHPCFVGLSHRWTSFRRSVLLHQHLESGPRYMCTLQGL